MFKVGSHDPFGHWKHKLWPKEGQGVKLAVWLSTTKSLPDLLACRWRATCHWKALDKGYNFASNLITIEGFHTKLWGPKVAGVPMLAISGLPFGILGIKSHSDVGFAERCRVYYMGEGGGFPQVRAMVSLVNLKSPMARPSTKSAPIVH
jgi:hypothetical protein